MTALRIIGLAVATLLLFAGTAVAEPRVALVVGNSSYGGQLGDLGNPANDARLMAKTLRAIGFDVIEAEDADLTKMRRVIQEFGARLAESGAGATGLFFYAGHGLQVGGTNYLIPIAASIAREGDVDMEAVPVDLVMKQMAFAEAAVNIVILDACRNNPLARGLRSVSRGLAETSSRPMGSFIAYSTAPGDVAEDGEGANSPYTTALAAAITKPGVSINDVFQEVRGKVLLATNKKQVPWDASSLTAPFYFVPGAAPSVGSAVDPVELAFWDTVKDSKDAEDFAAYLAKYPDGNFVSLAQLRLKQLEPDAVAAAEPEPRAAAPSGPDAEACHAAEGDAAARAQACQRLLSAGIADETERYNVLMDLGKAFFDQERYEDALKNYRAAAALDPKYFGAFQMMGRVYLDHDQPAKALEVLEQAVRLDPKQADSIFYRGAAKRRLGDLDAASDDIERAVKMNPEEPDYVSESALMLLAKGDIAAAAAEADRAAQYEPDGWMIASMFAYYLGGRLDDALAMADRAQRADTGYMYWWIWKAMIQRAKGDTKGAATTLAEAQQKFDKSEWPRPIVDFMAGSLNAVAFRRIGQVGDAMDQKQRRCEIEFYIGIAAALDGNKAEARAALRRAQGTRVYEYVEYMVAPAVLASLEPR